VKLPLADQRAEPSPARDEGKASAELWEQVWKRENLHTALERVERNGGAPGIDGMTVEELRPYLRERWLELREALDRETYKPSPVRRVEIPKPDGGVRQLGIPMMASYCTSYREFGDFWDKKQGISMSITFSEEKSASIAQRASRPALANRLAQFSDNFRGQFDPTGTAWFCPNTI
jgi:retron-type reverse transcriptase